jgi:pimeloyl-ACP methyl ester carboxylesterase
MMLPAARELHDMGCDTLLIDFRGCGGSSGNATTIGFKEADVVIAAVRFAREEFAPDRVILFGDSMGAAAVIRAASLEPKLADGLIIAAPFDRLLSTVENRFVAMNLPPFPFARLICFWGGVQHGYWAFDHDPARYATTIHLPVLHIHGAHDPRVTTGQAESLFDHFAGPKRFALFENTGHASHLHVDRAKWMREVQGFVESPDDSR